MAGPFVTNGYHVRLQYTLSAQLVENEFYFVSLVSPTEAVMDELADVVLDWATLNWHNFLPTNCAVTGCVVECLDETFLFTKPYSLPAPVAGSGSAGAPNNVSFSIQRIILGRYKGGHPRLYVPGIRLDKITSINTLDATHADNMVTELNALILAAIGSTSDFTPVCLRTTGPGSTPGHPAPINITAYKYRDLNLDSQRRRLPGRGR